MQFSIDLPDELEQELLQQDNIQQFIQEAIKKKLSEEKGKHLPITQSLIGLLKGSDFDCTVYEKHLEDKHL
jgi:hypothetical protein